MNVGLTVTSLIRYLTKTVNYSKSYVSILPLSVKSSNKSSDLKSVGSSAKKYSDKGMWMISFDVTFKKLQ